MGKVALVLKGCMPSFDCHCSILVAVRVICFWIHFFSILFLFWIDLLQCVKALRPEDLGYPSIKFGQALWLESVDSLLGMTRILKEAHLLESLDALIQQVG
jgi:hypothetical protein